MIDIKSEYPSIHNEFMAGLNKCRGRYLFFPLIIFLVLFLFTPSHRCEAEDWQPIEKNYGENKPGAAKILVAYATRAGSTAEIADAIGKKLAEGGARVDVMPVGKVQSIGGYSAVVLGSAIRMGNTLPEMNDFADNHKDELREIPVAYFAVCMILRENTPKNQEKAYAYIKPLTEVVMPVDTAVFAGKMDYSRLTFFEKLVIKYIVRVPEGDLRDWQLINNWAAGLLPKLTNRKKEE
ncbi:MAG TPA: flavodoxin domain-containing protein [Smithella sp.]|nr:flavodoxin domain-containing protein [Smithella sp.]